MATTTLTYTRSTADLDDPADYEAEQDGYEIHVGDTFIGWVIKNGPTSGPAWQAFANDPDAYGKMIHRSDHTRRWAALALVGALIAAKR